MEKHQYLYQLELRGYQKEMSVQNRMKITDFLLRIYNYLERKMDLVSETLHSRFKEEHYETLLDTKVTILMVDPEYRHRAFLDQKSKYKCVTFDTLFEFHTKDEDLAIAFCDLYEDIKDDDQTIYLVWRNSSWAIHLDYAIPFKDYLEDNEIKWIKLLKCLIQKYHEEI
jgi:hypothetical protein